MGVVHHPPRRGRVGSSHPLDDNNVHKDDNNSSKSIDSSHRFFINEMEDDHEPLRVRVSDKSHLPTDYKNMASMYSLIPNESELLSSHDPLIPTSREDQTGSLDPLGNTIDPTYNMETLASVQSKNDPEDDALSTITETTEPDGHNINSLQSSSNSFVPDNLRASLKERIEELENYSLEKYHAAAEMTPQKTPVSEEMTPQKTPASEVEFIAKRTSFDPDSISNRTSFQHDVNCSLSISSKRDILAASTNETGMSYTIDEGTLENALANGIPIITKAESENLSVNKYFDLNSSQEISTMQIEPEIDAGYVDDAVTANVHHLDTRASYDADDRLQKSEPSNSMYVKYHKTSSLVDTHENDRQSPENMNQKMESYIDKPVDLKVNKEVFSSVSYNHWPFTRAASKNTVTLNRNGQNIVCERLNNLNNEQRNSPLYTSWADLTKKNGYFSLEARENRLKQVPRCSCLQ